ncbi:hypothetical protein DRE_03253 [Drechslerella stenobrocha 248]|uniref:ubiquitinyl hydrolase 1 n=1 Tax=Drechslerella stenobrocha 248 TaxID=1043628 RepID=W7I653_9PEZI|nr:hypothetical protein DRE_03253 [Drechslerella stenobrocha 248]
MPGFPASSWAAPKALFSPLLNRIRSSFAGADPKVCVAFWLFGLINNVLYVIILSAALDLVGPDVPKGVVLLFDVMPSFLTKLAGPYFIHLISYRVRIISFFLIATCGMLVVAFGDSIGWRLFGIALASVASGAGEMTFISMTHFYDHFSLAMWGSGTGGAGIVGGVFYLALSTWIGFSIETSLMLSCFLPLVMVFAFFGILPRDALPTGSEREGVKGRYSRVPDEEEEQGVIGESEVLNNSMHSSNGSFFTANSSPGSVLARAWVSLKSNLRRMRGLVVPYILPLLLVYISEYTINQGVAPTLLYPLEEMPFKNYRDAYPTYNTIYQVGVFISRSSTPFIRVRHLYTPSTLQFLNLVLLTAQAVWNFIPTIWVIFLIIFWEGILGGMVYVNTFAEITDNVPYEDREFSLGATTVSDSGGICIAAFITPGLVSIGEIGAVFEVGLLENKKVVEVWNMRSSQRKRRLGPLTEGAEGPSRRRRLSRASDSDTPEDDRQNLSEAAPRLPSTRMGPGRPLAPDGHPEEADSDASRLHNSLARLQFIVTNVFLPPMLPNRPDNTDGTQEHALLVLLSDATESFGKALPTRDLLWWRIIQKNIKTMALLYEPDLENSLSPQKIVNSLKGMRDDFLTLYIRKQNAGLIIRKNTTEAIFESFEASCIADAVAECRRRLQCSFPGPRTAIPLQVFCEPKFLEQLSDFLAYMDGTTLDMSGNDSAAGSVKDTGFTSPNVITHLLTGITRGLGHAKTDQGARICKRVADAVLGTEKSVWRRAPIWLVVRVGLQTTLKSRGADGPDWYKSLLIYFMSKMTQLCIDHGRIGQDCLYILGAKVARRAHKLNDKMPEFVKNEVKATLERLSKFLKLRWEGFRGIESKQLTWDPTELDISSDCRLKLRSSGRYLESVLNGTTGLAPSELVRHRFIPGPFLRIYDPIDLDLDILKVPRKDLVILLMDIENWVDCYLGRYVEINAINKDQMAVVKLADLFSGYFKTAIQTYEGNPEDISVAFLTGFEIWVAMDKITTACTPLLLEYHPEIGEGHLAKLLLPTRNHMERLKNIQNYIMDRIEKAKIKARCFFGSKERITETSFQCKYFDQSPYHQDLMDRVNKAATVARQDMKNSLQNANKKYMLFMKEAAAMEHEYTKTGKHRRKNACQACRIENEAKQLTVGKHEWPLPQKDPFLSKALVFELAPPKHFVAWRDVTFNVLVNTSAVLQFTETDPETRCRQNLWAYTGLKEFYDGGDRRSGIEFASATKGVGRERDVRIKLPATDEDVVVEFSLRPRYWYNSGSGGHWVHDFLKLRGLWDDKIFSYELPRDSLYKPLQFAVRGCDHTSNDIIAIQHLCPAKLTPHEFYEYGTLRAGHTLQWHNICKTLKANSLNINKEEVSFLMLQAAWEAGPSIRRTHNMFFRDAHRVFDRTLDVMDILREIENALESIKTNWLELVSAATLIALTCRCLALIKDDQQAALTVAMGLVLKLRYVVYGWIEDLREKVKVERDSVSLAEKLQHLMHCAAVCRMTYDVPEAHAKDLIDGVVVDTETGRREPKPVSIFLETGAIIRDNLPPKREHVDDYFRHAIDRSSRLSHRWEVRIRDLILQNPEMIDIAIEKQWQRHTPQKPWKAADVPNQHWVQTLSKPESGNQVFELSFNLLNGQLLLDSTPFGRLSPEYVSHPTYERIFGKSILMVGPSSLRGMQFQSRFLFEGHQLHLALKTTGSRSELVIRSQRDGKVYELIPHNLFEGDMCESLIGEYTHWMDLDQSTIGFRKHQDKWNTEGCQWTLSLARNRSRRILARADDFTIHVMDPGSDTCCQVNKIFSPLESKEYILTTAKSVGNSETTVHAEIGRLNLKFTSKGDTFVCRNFSGYVVDYDQDSGCLYGLANKLVLRKENERMVIIPSGEVSLKKLDGFVLASINNARAYQAYSLDKKLGRLRGNGSTTSRLYQIYLHAITSSAACQVDPLTGRTGTEEAASILASGAVRSFQELGPADLILLQLIAQLTPKRVFGTPTKPNAPKKGRIESITWNENISFNCQRDIFRIGAKKLMDYWMIIRGFMPEGRNLDCEDVAIEQALKDKALEDGVYRGEEVLLRRAACRTETFYAHIQDTWNWSNGSGPDTTESEPPIEDASYPQVCQLVKSLATWKTGMEPPKLWSTFKNFTSTGVKGGNTSGKLQICDWLLKRSAGEIWCPLFQICRNASRSQDSYRLIFALASLTYRDNFEPKLVHALVTAAVTEDFKDDNLYKIPAGHFTISDGYVPNKHTLEKIIKNNLIVVYNGDHTASPVLNRKSASRGFEMANTSVQDSGIQRANLLKHYEDQWPIVSPRAPSAKDYNLINIESVHSQVIDYFDKVYRVHRFKKTVDNIQVVLKKYNKVRFKQDQNEFTPYRYEKEIGPTKGLISIEDIMHKVTAPSLDPTCNQAKDFTKEGLSQNVEVVPPTLRIRRLQYLFTNLSSRRNTQFQRVYANDLKNSIKALKSFDGNTGPKELPLEINAIKMHAIWWQEHVNAIAKSIRSRLDPIHFPQDLQVVPGQEYLSQAGLWPRVTAFGLLRHISCRVEGIPLGWKKVIVAYGIALRELGRVERLLQFAAQGDVQGFWETLANSKQPKWDAMEHPDWLLLELDNNFCMRDVQAEIAIQMIRPDSGKSSVMQMNMGEGKSSVIIPAVAAALADGKKLVRVVVLKPLSREMFNLLQSKLGGLCDRRIYFLPFHRGLEIGINDVKQMNSVYKDCLADRGILLVQNEHLLSFKLLGLQKICTEQGDDRVSRTLYETQKWLDTHSRDLLDESDEILRVNHTLVYTVGTQGPMSNQPYRWLNLLKVFDIIKAQLPEYQAKFPKGFEVIQKNGDSFPSVRILQLEAADGLMKTTATEIIYGNTPGHQWFSGVAPKDKKLILKFVTERDFSHENYGELREILRSGLAFEAALLFRGLIAYGTIRFCLQEKRWRVEYGADPGRTLLAVPYKSKDTPSSASDFAHPEASLCLTCLSWYSYGLDQYNLEDCLQLIKETENPEDEYQRWTRNLLELPEHLKSLKGVNVYDGPEFSQLLYPLLRYNKAVIDFYLEHCVFPKYAKQFPFKLTSSGWDLVERRPHVTSGFSGTNDNRFLLPLSIEQHDLDTHAHTNALVLNYLLAKENDHFIRAANSLTNIKMIVEELLDTIVAQNPPISVILDVGAQVLELDNQGVAREWLDRAAKADPDRWQAAIFFNAKDEICVIDRAGRVELLMTSNFAKQMVNCLCYLDDAHTRGTDLQFPSNSRALITLGPKTSKDRLIQGAMRMRKLGKGQSVVFCAPPDVEDQILAMSPKKNKIENVDVLKWALQETCKQTSKNAELWATQALNYLERRAACDEYASTKDWETLQKKLFEPEQLSLQDMYGVKDAGRESSLLRFSNPALPFNDTHGEIASRCSMFDIKSLEQLCHALDEEQEREVEQEVEVEREVHRPPPAKPLKHSLHPDLKKFVSTGTLTAKSEAVESAITSLRDSSIRDLIRPGSWSTKLLVSRDFAQTIEMPTHVNTTRRIGFQDEYIRPVSYILSSVKKKKAMLVIISPSEAHELMARLRKSKHVHLHTYMPRVTKSMASFEDLKWMNIGQPYTRKWCIPAVLMDQLNLFAGQLYFRHKTSYLRTAEWLSCRTNECDPEAFFHADGFIPSGERRLRSGLAFNSTFKTSPVPCLQGLMAIRRKGYRYESTHLGQLLHGKFICDDEFDETDSDIEQQYDEDEAVSADDAEEADRIQDTVELLPTAKASQVSDDSQTQSHGDDEPDSEDRACWTPDSAESEDGDLKRADFYTESEEPKECIDRINRLIFNGGSSLIIPGSMGRDPKVKYEIDEDMADKDDEDDEDDEYDEYNDEMEQEW